MRIREANPHAESKDPYTLPGRRGRITEFSRCTVQ
jgi:hypothetical protein